MYCAYAKTDASCYSTVIAERQRGRDPNKKKGSEPKRSEPELERYYIKVVSYRHKQTSEAPYDVL
jgi:hypothetical protein